MLRIKPDSTCDETVHFFVLSINAEKRHGHECSKFLVRAAETDPAGKALTDVGRKRVEALARLLMDSGIDVIYSSSISTGRRTAEPIEKALNIKNNLISPQLEVMDDLVRTLRTEHMSHRVLIVAGNTIRGHIAKAYSVKDIWKLRSDNLIVIVPRSGSEPLVIKMRW